MIQNEIILSYKKNGQQVEFKISRDKLFETLKQVLLNFKLIRISETIFCIDNIELIQKERNDSNLDNLSIREEAKLLDFHSSLSSQGFQVIDLKFDNNIAKLELRDMQEYSNFSTRAIHSSQFLYNLWLFTSSSRLIIDFSLFNGERFLTSEINSDNFIKNSNSNIKLSELLKDVEFTFVTINYGQNKNPFKDLELSEEIKNHPQIFYSQLGDKISVEDFIKQFSLSIFANYLAFKSEGLTETKINIGNDGAMIRTDNQEKNIVFSVPASIEDKALQLKLIEILESLINLYNSGELELEIVEQAKTYNKYFFKKHLIKGQLSNIPVNNSD